MTKASPFFKEKCSAILEAMAALSDYLGSEELPYHVIERIRDLTGAEYASFVLQEQIVIKYLASTDRAWNERKPSHTVIQEAFANGYALRNLSDPATATESQISQNIRSCLAVRIDIAGSVRGVVYCDIRAKEQQFSEEDAEILKQICRFFSSYFFSFSILESAKELREESAQTVNEKISDHSGLNRIIGLSHAMVQLREEIAHAARHKWPVLIQGDTGTGKELVARAIHYLSERARKPLVVVNCAALKPELIEAELFGVKKGAYTGAEYRKGRIQSADGGTLFLDEVGELPYDVQAKLLRAVEFNEVQMLGTDDLVENVDFRLITATNRNLHQMVREGKFRLDFLERIRVKRIWVAPLKERKEDIPLLAEFYANPKQLTKEAIDYLKDLDYPGNVRRLRTIVIMARDHRAGVQIEKKDIQEIVYSLDEEYPAAYRDVVPEVEEEIKDLEWYRFRRNSQRAVREYTQLRKGNNLPFDELIHRLRPEWKSDVVELRERLTSLYENCGNSWFKVAREIFKLEKSEKSNFVAWIYILQGKGILPKTKREKVGVS